MVSISPRMRDSLDYEDPETIDPRLSLGFRSMSLESSGHEEYEFRDDSRPQSASGDPSATRKKRRLRRSDLHFSGLNAFRYTTVADGDDFRLAVLYPGTGLELIQLRLIWESSKKPQYDYKCLSYCWETVERDADIICDGYRFAVTKNLLSALRSLRKPTTNLLIWADQICINQDDDAERGHQVSIMKNIFSQAKKVIVWLGEEDKRIVKLCEYAKKMERWKFDSTNPKQRQKGSLSKILNPRELQAAIQKLLLRPWFQRVWMIPEVALARFTVVACGKERISWDNLVRLIRDVDLPRNENFDKQAALLGNPRQRIAIITQMTASQRAGLHHTDITQLLILAKSSEATDVRDKIYAFYGLTLLTTFPNYTRSVESLYHDIIHMYVNSIKWETYYSTWHGLTEEQRTHQLMSILYSAGALHQHYTLPSWIPDFTFAWNLAPIWCKTTTNIVTGSGKDEWTARIRCDFRAGGSERGEFEIVDDPNGMQKLRLSVILFDTIAIVSENILASTAEANERSFDGSEPTDSATLRYGRHYFRTIKGQIGIATPGVKSGDKLAIVLGGDVPVVLRPLKTSEGSAQAYKLLCECFVQNDAVMQGDLVRTEWTSAEDVDIV